MIETYSEVGQVAAVEVEEAGGNVVGDHPAGSTTIQLDDASDFPEIEVQARLGGTVVDVAAVDPDTDVITLASPSPVALEDGERVFVHPSAPTTWAHVIVDQEEEALQVEVPFGVKAFTGLAVGDLVRFTESSTTGALTLVEVVGADPTLAPERVHDGEVHSVWSLAAGGTIVAGDPGGSRVEMTYDGVRVYRLGPNGIPYEATTLTGTDTAMSVVDQDGTVLGGLTSQGDVSGRRVSAGDLFVQGVRLLGQLAGHAAPGWLDLLPRGRVPGGSNATSLAVPYKDPDTETVYLKLEVNLKAGRFYHVFARLRANVDATDGVLRSRLRWAQGRVDPTTSSPELDQFTTGKAYTGPINMATSLEALVTVDVDGPVRFGVTYEGKNGARAAGRFARITALDVGPRNDGEIGGGGEDETTRTTYQTTWTATSSRRYDKTGATMPNSDGLVDLWAWHADPTAFESAAWVYNGGATESTHTIELGKTLPAALSGATIHRAEIYLHNKSFYSSEVGYISLASLAANVLPESKQIDGSLFVGDLAPGAGFWVEVPATWFTNGANTGVQMGDKDGRHLNGAGQLVPMLAAAFHGINDPNPPLARFTYSR